MPKGIGATAHGAGGMAVPPARPLGERVEVLAVRVDAQKFKVRLLVPQDLKSDPLQAADLNRIVSALEGDFKRTLGGRLDERIRIESLEVHVKHVMPASARIALMRLHGADAHQTQQAIHDWIVTIPAKAPAKPPPKAAAEPPADEPQAAGGPADPPALRKHRKFVPGERLIVDRPTVRETKSARFVPQPFAIERIDAWFSPGDGFQPVQVSRFQPTLYVPGEAIRHVRLGTRAGKGGHLHPHQLLALGITAAERAIRAGNESRCWGLMQAGLDAQFQKFQGVLPAALDDIQRAGSYPRDYEPKGLFPRWLGEHAILARADTELAGGLSNGFDACTADDDTGASAGSPYARKVGKTVEIDAGPFPVRVRLIAGVLHADAQAADPPLYLVTAYPADPVKAVLQQAARELGAWVDKDAHELLARGLAAGQMGLVYNRLVELIDERVAGQAAGHAADSADDPAADRDADPAGDPVADPPPRAIAYLEYASNLLRVVYSQKFVRPLKLAGNE